MNDRVFLTVDNSPAVRCCAEELEERGQKVISKPSNAVTHLILPVPTRQIDPTLLTAVPDSAMIIGGFLDQPELMKYRRFDLLKDETYLAHNAAITAHCAAAIASVNLPRVFSECSMLVIGWGRIGKCLGRLLQDMGASVTIAARNPKDRAMIAALGYEAENPADLNYILRRYRVIFNTVPSPILSENQVAHCHPGCLKIDLASKPGIAGDNVIIARGLPGKYAPESAGKLMARTILRHCTKMEGAL